MIEIIFAAVLVAAVNFKAIAPEAQEVIEYENIALTKEHQTQLLTRIKQVNPELTHAKAVSIEDSILKASFKYKLDPYLFAAILATESNFENYTARRCKSRKKGCYSDYGIGQVHISNIRARKLNKNKLLHNVEYSTLKSAEILSWFKMKYAKHEKFWFLRYNCGVKPSIYRKTCMRYLMKVDRYYNFNDSDMARYLRRAMK